MTYSEQVFEQKLYQLKDTHDSIANLSNWCLQNQEHYKEIVGTWLNVLKRVRIEQRLLMFYLANDVIQYSKRKQLPYVDAFAPALQKATTMVRDNSIRNKILRLFKIWDDRKVYDESFLVDLSGLLTHGNKANPRIDVEDYQPQILYSRLRSCQTLEKESKQKMKNIEQSSFSLKDVEHVSTTLKDRKVSEEVVSEIDEIIGKVSEYIKALEAEVKERKGLTDLLETSEQYYEREYKEAKIVVNAYKCFTNRVKAVKKKAEEKIELLETKSQTQMVAVKQDYDDVFASHESFMTIGDANDPAFLNCYRPEPVVRKNLNEGRPNGPERANLPAILPTNLPDQFVFTNFNQPPPPPPPNLENENWDSSYSSLDQRLALHKFSHGVLEMKTPPDQPLESLRVMPRQMSNGGNFSMRRDWARGPTETSSSSHFSANNSNDNFENVDMDLCEGFSSSFCESESSLLIDESFEERNSRKSGPLFENDTVRFYTRNCDSYSGPNELNGFNSNYGMPQGSFSSPRHDPRLFRSPIMSPRMRQNPPSPYMHKLPHVFSKPRPQNPRFCW